MALRFASLYDLPEGDLQFRVEEWDDRGSKMLRCLCASADISGARAAYEAIVAGLPRRTIILRQRTRVILTTEHD